MGSTWEVRTGDESSSNQACWPGHNSAALYDDADNEDADVENNAVLPREYLSEEPTVETAKPGAEFENGCQPAFLRLVRDPWPHICGF